MSYILLISVSDWVHIYTSVIDFENLKIDRFCGTVFSWWRVIVSLQWRHNGRRVDWLLNRFFRHRSKKISTNRVTGLWEGNPPVTGGFPSQRASNAGKCFHLMTSSYVWIMAWRATNHSSPTKSLVHEKLNIVLPTILLTVASFMYEIKPKQQYKIRYYRSAQNYIMLDCNDISNLSFSNMRSISERADLSPQHF